MSRKPVEPDLPGIFASGATCIKPGCGNKADSYAQMKAENWTIGWAVDDNDDWISSEGPWPECPSHAAG
jgi:hypothetical protein